MSPTIPAAPAAVSRSPTRVEAVCTTPSRRYTTSTSDPASCRTRCEKSAKVVRPTPATEMSSSPGCRPAAEAALSVETVASTQF